MLSFRVEPLIIDFFQLPSLFQTGIFVIDGINEFLIIAYQTQFSRRNIGNISCQVLESELFQLSLNGYLTPEEIIVCASLYTGKRIFWRVVFNCKRGMRIRHQNSDGCIIIGFHNERIFFSQQIDLCQRLFLRTPDGDNTVEMKQVACHDIGPLHIIKGEGKDEVCFTTLKGFCGHIPLLHYIAVRDVQTIENDVKHLDVIAIRFALVVAELIRWELPVADNDERLLFRIFMYLLSCGSQQGAMKYE